MKLRILRCGNSGAIPTKDLLQMQTIEIGSKLDDVTLRTASREYTMDGLLAASPPGSFELSSEDRVWLDEIPIGIEQL